MIPRNEPEAIVLATAIVKQYPRFKDWLDRWLQAELNNLPFTADTRTGVQQGRCQVLMELSKFLQEAPDNAAKRKQP